MRYLSVYLLFILAMLHCTSVDAQKLTDEWRVIKKSRTDANGQKFISEYNYTNDGKIESVKYLTAAGAVNITISDFKYARNGKPSSYIVTWNREAVKVNVTVKYDNEGRIIELERINDNNRETSLFTYRYTDKTIVVIQKKSNSTNPIKDNKITYYTELGYYNETASDAATQTITSVLTLKENNRKPEPHPDNFMGGFVAPDFLGIIAFGSEPEITAIKNENGLITSLTYIARNSNRTYEYTYAKIKSSEPVENNPETIITTNIACAAGKEIVERILKSQDGVFSVKADIRTGKLTLAYSSDGTPYTEIINLINEAGFDADRKKSTAPEKNPCITKTEPTEKSVSSIIRTNITCELGKEKIETRLKEQNGVLNAELDLNTAKVNVEYNRSIISLDKIIQVINQAGFDADKNKTSNPEGNPCNKKSDTEVKSTSITIQTNINCEEGKQNIESLLKEQNGIVNIKTDIRTGKLLIEYSKSDISVTDIITFINRAGFDADKKTSSSPDNNPCIIKTKPVETTTKQTGINIFDARKGFAKAPIKFVPFVVTPDAAKKGFKMDSVYTWVAPDGKTKQASGEEILEQVNAMEKELTLRGHTLRKRDAFNGLNYKLVNPNALLRTPKPVTKISNNVEFNSSISQNYSSNPVIKTRHNTVPKVSGAIANFIPGDVGIYFGSITSNKGEYQGMISTTGTVDNSKCNAQCPLDITLSLDATKIQSLNISQCVLEISANPNRQPNDDAEVLAVGKFNFKSPAKEKNGIQNVAVNGEVPPANHTLYYFPVILNDLSKLGKAAIQPSLYYVYVKFYNAKGELLYYSSYNTAILENKIAVPIFVGADKNVSVNLEDAFTDPTGLFGMYYKANNLNAAYSIKRDDATLQITENTKLSGDIEIGAQYYNFWYLLDDDQPRFERKSIVSANFSSDYINKYKAGVPDIRVPGSKKGNDMNGYAGYQVNYSLYDFEKDWDFDKKSSNTETKGIGYTIFDERFFIGPVPCRFTVSVSGNASFTRQAVMDTLTNGNVSIATEVKPHLELKVSGSGAVDAGVAYAKVVCDVKVIEVDLPISVKANVKADIDAALVITALSGRVYFEAGLCVPIPFFDDICTSFKIDIFDWTGPSKTYPLVK